MSRFRLFVLIAALAGLTTALAACGGGGGDAQSVLEDATLNGIESGKLDLSVKVKSEGKEAGNVVVSLSGPFMSGGPEALPRLAMEAKASGSVNGEPVDFEGGLVLLPDRAFVGYQGTVYEVDPTTFGFIKSGFEQAQQQGSSEPSGGVGGCQEAVSGLGVSEFVENLSDEGSADVAGTSTTKISGDLDVSGAIDSVIKVAEDPACGAGLEATGALPLGELRKAKAELASAVKKAHVDVYVGDDHIIRRIAAELTIEPKGSGERVEVAVDLSISGVNEAQKILPPKGAKPLDLLFRKLGVNPLELLELGSGGGGLGGLLEGIEGGSSGGGSSGGSSSGGSSGGSSSGGESSSGSSGGESSQKAYLECLQGAETPVDLQNCASLLQ